MPDPWLDHQNPWEIPRFDNSVEVKLFGEATKGEDGLKGTWTGGLEVLAVPFDVPVPGFGTKNVNNLVTLRTLLLHKMKASLIIP